jgi:hypothetical protein
LEGVTADPAAVVAGAAVVDALVDFLLLLHAPRSVSPTTATTKPLLVFTMLVPLVHCLDIAVDE